MAALNWYSPHRIISKELGDEISCITLPLLKKWLEVVRIRINKIIGNCFSIVPQKPNFPSMLNYIGSVFPKFADDLIIIGKKEL